MKERILKLFTDLQENHCCLSDACDKVHLYCGYELDHGIELEKVIDMIRAVPDEEVTQ